MPSTTRATGSQLDAAAAGGGGDGDKAGGTDADIAADADGGDGGGGAPDAPTVDVGVGVGVVVTVVVGDGVRDDEGSGLLEECFESVRPFVEEIVVVDTGSKDGTPGGQDQYKFA